ncbi:MAG TPA: UDP-N-acetylmuramoyl-tripeptide--D-alanyl-D-alanine ligase [Candidatus Saccharibacteria bacterium]|nr:UDP-N-acetylmuramoyl-tripeptide--D-alanyl-D-alanine ligase [Candidatus Saccharibacteria bacterium]
MLKDFIQKRLEHYVRQYFKTHPEVKLVAVAGSVGKTSTKVAIATVLARQFRVRMEDTNHNTHMSAPLAMLGIEYPENVHNIPAWISVFWAALKRVKQPTDVDVIVQELGTDHPDEIAHFMSYLQPDIGVVTGVTPEHMEFFHDIETVAKEELALANGSKLAIINRDDVDGRSATYMENASIDTYGSTSAAEYRIEIDNFDIAHGYDGRVIAPELQEPLPVNVRVLGEHSLRPVTAAITVALKLGMSGKALADGVEDIEPVNGRMNVLRGLKDSILIDDTYNSSPASASAALQALYALQGPQKIAILGDMNELGDSSAAEHEALGKLCDPAQLAWVVTVGEQANKHIAPIAKSRGCQVKVCANAIEAGEFVASVLEPHAIVLAKGSQSGIYLEEALKIVLHETHEDHDLVRQSPKWQQTKQEFFESLNS